MTTKYFTCSFCHENTKLSTSASDRVDLERDRGEKFMATCSTCHKPRSIHVNDVKAQPNMIITGIGVLAAIVAVVALWRVGFIASIALALPVIIYGVQVKEAETFNAYSLPRR